MQPKSIAFICGLVLLLSIFALLNQNGIINNQNDRISTNSSVLLQSRWNTSTPGSGLKQKRLFIMNMTHEAFEAYERRAWGKPIFLLDQAITSVVHQGRVHSPGHAIVASMSTLWVMGLKQQFARGKQWISEKLHFAANQRRPINVALAVSEYIGGLLSCYRLSGEKVFLDKAQEVAQVLQSAYGTSTGLPPEEISPSDPDAQPHLEVSISNAGGHTIEYNYLHNLTRAVKYQNITQAVRRFFARVDKPEGGLYPSLVNVRSGRWASNRSTLSLAGRDFYYGLVKSYIQSSGRDGQAIELYAKAMDAVEERGMIVKNTKSGMAYSRYYDIAKRHFGLQMKSSACYLGAMLSLGAQSLSRELAKKKQSATLSLNAKRTMQQRVERHLQLAVNLTETCHLAAVRTKTGLLPGTFFYTFKKDVVNFGGLHYSISAELSESYFVLWRLTHDPKYREYAWQMAQAIHAHCRTESGAYANVEDVDQVPTVKEFFQPSESLFATLKYLYLTFTDDTVLPLDSWLFNSQGHPLPVIGKVKHG